MRPGEFVDILKESYREWRRDKASRLAAALAYYTVFSLPSLLIIVIAITAFAFGREAAQGRIVGQIQDLVGRDTARLLEDMVRAAAQPSRSIPAAVFGFAMLLFGASGFFGQLQDALNTAWEVEPSPKRGVMGLIKDRFLSFTMVLGTGFLLLVSLVLSAGVSALAERANDLLPGLPTVLYLANFLLSFVVITVLFATIYKMLPDTEIAWDDVWVGAAATSLLFVLGKELIGLYLGRSGVASVYGAAGSIVILLLWVYYSAQILLFGAEFTQVYSRRVGRPEREGFRGAGRPHVGTLTR